jgi:hypothetical protein
VAEVIPTTDDALLTEAEVRELLSDRFDTVCAGSRCCPLIVDGQRRYLKSLVERGMRTYLDDGAPPRQRGEVRKAHQSAPRPAPSPGGGASRGLSPAVVRRAWSLLERIEAALRRRGQS